jgi:hypothetical protein
MKLFLISQSYNDGYDTYDSAVVAARDEEAAREVAVGSTGSCGTWAKPKHVAVEDIGTAKTGTKAGTVICASFNAG